MIGVYQIRNEVTGKSYIGSSCVSVFHRIAFHIRELRKSAHKNRHLQAAWNKDGEKSFTCAVLEIVTDKKDLAFYVERREQFYIDSLPNGMTYNICLVAGSRFGTSISDEAKKKIGVAFRGKPLSEEHKEKLRKANKGQGKGRKLSAEVCAKMSKARIGLRHTEASKNKLSAGRKRIIFTDEHRSRLSEGQKRRYSKEGMK